MPISRLFENPDDAAAAVSELKQAGFGVVPITVAPVASGPNPLLLEGPAGHSGVGYAEPVAGAPMGATQVIIDPPLGTGARAVAILERHRPHDTGVAKVTYLAPAAAEEDDPKSGAAPLSRALGWPTLLKNNPAPLSSWLNIPTLWRGKNAFVFSTKLSSKAAPLSSWLGLPTLSGNATPLSSWLNWGTLSRNPAPLSSLLNMRVLTTDP